MIKHGFRTIITGALVLSVLFFIILPWQYPGFSVKPYLHKITGLNFSSVNPAKHVVTNPSKPNSNKNIIRTDRLIYIPIVVVGTAAFLYAIYYLFIRSRNKILAKQMSYFKIIPFGTFELKDIGIAKGFLISLAQNLRNPWDSIILGQPWFRYILKKNAGDGLVEIYFGVPADRTQPFINSFNGYYDQIQLKQLTEIEAANMIPNHKRYKVSSFGTLSKDPLPIKMYEGATKDRDPLEIIIAGMGGGKPSDVDLVVDVLMKPIPEYRNLYQVGARYIHRMRVESYDETDIPSLLASQGDADKKKRPKKTLSDYEKDYIKVVKERCTAPEKAFKTSIKIYAGGQGDILMALKSASDGFSTLNAFNSLVAEAVVDPWRMKHKILEGRFGVHEGFTLSSSELVGFVRIPDSTLNCFSYIDSIDAQIVRAPQSISSENTAPEEMFLVDSDVPVTKTEIENKKDTHELPQGEILSDVMEMESGMGDMGDMIKQYKQAEMTSHSQTESTQKIPSAPPPTNHERSAQENITHVIKEDNDDEGFDFD